MTTQTATHRSFRIHRAVIALTLVVLAFALQACRGPHPHGPGHLPAPGHLPKP